jgi:hypothetical protein
MRRSAAKWLLSNHKAERMGLLEALCRVNWHAKTPNGPVLPLACAGIKQGVAAGMARL